MHLRMAATDTKAWGQKTFKQILPAHRNYMHKKVIKLNMFYYQPTLGLVWLCSFGCLTDYR